jgi:hypothetical protein
MVSNLLKRWRDDFATVKRKRDGFGAFGKETGCHPAPRQALEIYHMIHRIYYSGVTVNTNRTA